MTIELTNNRVRNLLEFTALDTVQPTNSIESNHYRLIRDRRAGFPQVSHFNCSDGNAFLHLKQ